mgnify:CR=1 FL=1
MRVCVCGCVCVCVSKKIHTPKITLTTFLSHTLPLSLFLLIQPLSHIILSLTYMYIHKQPLSHKQTFALTFSLYLALILRLNFSLFLRNSLPQTHFLLYFLILSLTHINSLSNPDYLSLFQSTSWCIIFTLPLSPHFLYLKSKKSNSFTLYDSLSLSLTHSCSI